MLSIHTELALNTIIAKQNSPINVLSQEKFSNFLNTTNEEETVSTETMLGTNIIMQSLQNTAQLNKMVIEFVA